MSIKRINKYIKRNLKMKVLSNLLYSIFTIIIMIYLVIHVNTPIGYSLLAAQLIAMVLTVSYAVKDDLAKKNQGPQDQEKI